MCLREFSAVLVAITHTDGTVAVHVLDGSLQTILNIIELGFAGSCVISFILIKKFNQMDFYGFKHSKLFIHCIFNMLSHQIGILLH